MDKNLSSIIIIAVICITIVRVARLVLSYIILRNSNEFRERLLTKLEDKGIENSDNSKTEE